MSQAVAGVAPRSSVRWRVFVLIGVLTVVNLADRTSLAVGMPSIARDLHIAPSVQGVILSAFFWTYAAMQLPSGWLIDRFGPSRLIAWAALLWGAFQTLMFAVGGGLSLILLRLGLGAAEAPMFPAGGKLNALWLPPSERGRGAVMMDSGSYLGAAIGGIGIAWLIAVLDSWRLAFGIAGLITLALGIYVAITLRDDPATHPAINDAELAHIRQADTARPTVYPTADGVTVGTAAPIMIGRIGWAMVNFGLLTWGPSYLAQARGLDLKQMGAATFAIFGAGFLGSLSAGFLADGLVAAGLTRRVTLRMLLTISGLAVFAAFLILPHIPSAVSAVMLLAATDFMLCGGSLYWSLPSILAPPARAGLLGAWMNLAGSVGGIIVPIIAGLLLQATGTYTAVLVFFALCAALYILGTLLIPLPRGTT